MSERPSTSSTLWAEWRRGLKDLQDKVLNPWGTQVATHEEQGTIANPTPQIVTADIAGARANSVTGNPEKVYGIRDDMQKGYGAVVPDGEPKRERTAYDKEREQHAPPERKNDGRGMEME